MNMSHDKYVKYTSLVGVFTDNHTLACSCLLVKTRSKGNHNRFL
ncbi:hypothetical protein [Pontibacter arcticus]|nr:hypothetical protein [Pontibacter arcticus]